MKTVLTTGAHGGILGCYVGLNWDFSYCVGSRFQLSHKWDNLGNTEILKFCFIFSEIISLSVWKPWTKILFTDSLSRSCVLCFLTELFSSQLRFFQSGFFFEDESHVFPAENILLHPVLFCKSRLQA